MYADIAIILFLLCSFSSTAEVSKATSDKYPFYFLNCISKDFISKICPTFTIAAELDPLNGDAKDYHKLLEENGAKNCAFLEVFRVSHGFFTCLGFLREAEETFQKIQDWWLKLSMKEGNVNILEGNQD
jgi:acetyl esterase/lipase